VDATSGSGDGRIAVTAPGAAAPLFVATEQVLRAGAVHTVFVAGTTARRWASCGATAGHPAGSVRRRLAPSRRGPCAPRNRSAQASRPARKSSTAWKISCCVFITKGPYCAIGSRSGRPAMRMARAPSAPACSTTPSGCGRGPRPR
jgi:hypothetical protein